MTPKIVKNSVFPAVVLVASAACLADDANLIDPMETLPQLAAEKVTAELVEGKFGRAVKLRFGDNCQNVYAQTRSRAATDWDGCDGFSFSVRPDIGSSRKRYSASW